MHPLQRPQSTTTLRGFPHRRRKPSSLACKLHSLHMTASMRPDHYDVQVLHDDELHTNTSINDDSDIPRRPARAPKSSAPPPFGHRRGGHHDPTQTTRPRRKRPSTSHTLSTPHSGRLTRRRPVLLNDLPVQRLPSSSSTGGSHGGAPPHDPVANIHHSASLHAKVPRDATVPSPSTCTLP